MLLISKLIGYSRGTFNDFDTSILPTLAFPNLFPDGKGDPTNKATVNEISYCDTDMFCKKMEHFVRNFELINDPDIRHRISCNRSAC